MSSNGASRDVVELWGREFNIVRNGLAEAQVVSFVNDLAKQHDLLLQRQDHLATLTRLAERTVSEADKLAEDIKAEARKAVESETARLVAEAQEAARTRSETMLAEMKTRAESELAEKERLRLADIEKEAKRVLSEAESRARHIVEQKEAEAVTSATTAANAILTKARHEASGLLEREKQRIQPELNQFILRFRGQLLSELDHLKNQVGSLEHRFQMPTPPLPDAVSAARPAGKRDDLLSLVGDSEGTDDGDVQWQVEIVPPIDIMKIMSIVAHLDSQPTIKKTEIIPRHDGTSIMVYGQDIPDILESLKGLPEVGHAEGTGSETGSPRRINLSLSSKDAEEDSSSQNKVSERAK